MAGPKGSKYFDIFLNYQVWLESKNRAGLVRDGLVDLLREIHAQGSIKAAATKKNISYRKAWGDVKDAEEFLGFSLLETVRGGKDGGLSRLTRHGQELVTAFDDLHEQFDQAIYRIIRTFFAQLNRYDETPLED